MPDQKPIHILILAGDGIGPEVTSAARRVLDQVAEGADFDLLIEEAPFGGEAIDKVGRPLPPDVLLSAHAADAVLLGAIGGPAWDDVARELRPESGLLRLRKELGVFANLRPVQAATSPRGGGAIDLLIVRELTGGIYFGTPRQYTAEEAFDTLRYSAEEIDRIAHVAFQQARMRSSRVTSVDKANVLASSRLWRERVSALQAEEYPDVELRHMYVDNAAMQIVQDPGSFDVILTGNLFGDILSDLASTLVGSLGLLPSASMGNGTPVFEPVHGSAPDIAGKDQANPVAAIRSLAMLMDQVGQPEAAGQIRRAVDETLNAGVKTVDLDPDGVSTSRFTTSVLQALARIQDTSRIPEPSAEFES